MPEPLMFKVSVRAKPLNVEISVDDENGKTKRDIQRLILTLNLLTSWYGEFLDE